MFECVARLQELYWNVCVCSKTTRVVLECVCLCVCVCVCVCV
jgi:hypothetical protein